MLIVVINIIVSVSVLLVNIVICLIWVGVMFDILYMCVCIVLFVNVLKLVVLLSVELVIVLIYSVMCGILVVI